MSIRVGVERVSVLPQSTVGCLLPQSVSSMDGPFTLPLYAVPGTTVGCLLPLLSVS